MAYKDEYEVARLHLDAVEQAKLRAEFGADAEGVVQPAPAAAARARHGAKLKLGAWFVPAFRALAASRRLRGTRLDPFGRAQVRRVERELIGEYERLVRDALAQLTPALHGVVAELADLPDVIRGYEDIKLRNVERFRARAAELREQIARGEPQLPPTAAAELPIAPVRG